MNTQERKNLRILIVLLVVLGATLLLVNLMNRPPTADSVEAAARPATASPLPAPSDARIRLDILNPENAAEDAGRRDLFRYGQAPPPPQMPVVSTPGASAAIPSQVLTPSPPLGPPAATAPPPIPLQYQGFAVDRSPEGGYVAFLAEGTAKHYNVKVGEVLMGRYRIARISEASVEVEDLQYNRRQTLPVLK